MKFRMTLLLLLIAGATLLASCTSKKEQQTTKEDPSVAGRVEDWVFTKADLEDALSALPENKRAEYDTPGGRAEIVDKAIREEMYHREGLKAGYDNDEEVQRKLEKYKRALVIAEYFNRNVKPMTYPKEDELHEYYENHKGQYTTLPVRRAQHIFSKNREKLVDFKKRIDAGEPMTTLAQKFSEDDLTRASGGDVGYFNPGGYIRGVGYSKTFSDAVFAMDRGVVSDPIKWEKGYSLIRVTEIRPAKLRPFSDVRESILSKFVKRNIEEVEVRVHKELAKHYDVTNVLAEKLKTTQRTPEELWNLAQTSSDPYHRLRNYQEIVDRFPKSDQAAKAMFMVGFVYAEELKDRVAADRAFTRVVNEYPDADVAQSAQWMLKNMSGPLPEFEDIDELNRKLSGGSD